MMGPGSCPAPETRPEFDFVTAAPCWPAILNRVRKVAPTQATVLVTGETGTGKEVIARAIHKMSPRRDHPFVALNCAALPAELIENELFGHERGSFTGALNRYAGVFEQADGGTLFLDEIGEMPIEMQTRLLRVLEERAIRRVGGSSSIAVDVRVIAATNRDPMCAIDEKKLRLDLYYRLAVFCIQLLPLRERTEDIVPLVNYLIPKFVSRHGLTTDMVFEETGIDSLLLHPWPGNVRELVNAVERALILAEGSVVSAKNIASQLEVSSQRNVPPAVYNFEILKRWAFQAAFKRFGNTSRVAAACGITRKTASNYRKKLDL